MGTFFNPATTISHFWRPSEFLEMAQVTDMNTTTKIKREPSLTGNLTERTRRVKREPSLTEKTQTWLEIRKTVPAMKSVGINPGEVEEKSSIHICLNCLGYFLWVFITLRLVKLWILIAIESLSWHWIQIEDIVTDILFFHELSHFLSSHMNSWQMSKIW